MGARLSRGGALVAALVVCLGPPAAARSVEGVVVRLTDDEMVVDVGARLGVPEGAKLQVFRRLVVKHPLSGREIEDRFPIGTVPLAQRGERLSIVRDLKGLDRKPQAGDFVVYTAEAEPQAPVAVAPVAAPPPPPAPKPDESALETTLRANLGRPLPERIERFEAFLKTYPRSAAVDAVGAEVLRLRSLDENERTLAQAAAKPAPPERLVARFAVPSTAVTGAPVELALTVDQPEQVETARVLARRSGGRAYDTVPMRRDGDFYWRATLPRELTATPGDVEYFVEAVRSDAALEPVGDGNAQAPLRLRVVERRDDPEKLEDRSRAAFAVRYVDFNTGGAADHYLQSEGDFTYALELGVLRALRVGVGLIDGEGGPTDAIDAGAPSRSLTLGYGFAEAELALGDSAGLAGRILGGNHRATSDGRAASVVGGEGRLRLGHPDGTRLVLGASVLEDVGNRGFADLYVEAFPRFPIRAGVTVTNLPVDADLGVQLALEGGWRVSDLWTLTLMTGWNARTIRHYGFSAGGGAVLTW